MTSQIEKRLATDRKAGIQELKVRTDPKTICVYQHLARLVSLMVTPAAWPLYNKGELVMLFLHKPASETGFQTTAGLTQGKFMIQGNKIANDINNESLFAGVKINSKLNPTHEDLIMQSGGSYTTDDFVSLVKTAVEESWIQNGVMTDEK